MTTKTTGGTLRRMILLLMVAALMAAMVAVSAMPAMAKNTPGTGPPLESGNNKGSLVAHSPGGACVAHAKGHGGTDTGGGC
jgi:Spy/CpxP family protein refolding chaperone